MQHSRSVIPPESPGLAGAVAIKCGACTSTSIFHLALSLAGQIPDVSMPGMLLQYFYTTKVHAQVKLTQEDLAALDEVRTPAGHADVLHDTCIAVQRVRRCVVTAGLHCSKGEPHPLAGCNKHVHTVACSLQVSKFTVGARYSGAVAAMSYDSYHKARDEHRQQPTSNGVSTPNGTN